MFQRASLYFIAVVTLMSLAVFSGGCGSDSESGSDYAPTELGELVTADESTFDVDWKPEAIVAGEAAVFEDLEDLQPYNGIFRVPSTSSLLEGVSVGSIVVWPQVGIFEVVYLRPAGDVVEIETKWAKLSDAVSRADISFRHALRAGEPGRAVGVQPAPTTPAQQERGIAMQPITAEAGPLSYSEEGLKYKGDGEGLETELSVDGDTVTVSFSSNAGGTKVNIKGSASGLSADGVILLNEGEDEPTVRIRFNDIKLSVSATLSVKGAKGTASIVPPAQMVFPFAIGPMPAYIAVGTDIEVESSIGSSDDLFSLSAGFTLTGDVALTRNADGSVQASGAITRFDTQQPEFSSSVHLTSGVALRFSAPRLSFGIGRPGLANGGVYGKKSIEFLANTTLNPFEGTTCAQLSTDSATFVGGELSIFGFSISRESQITRKTGVSHQEGELCQ